MITRKVGKVEMTLKAGCYWGEWCDVAIFQEWKGTQHGDITQYIEMNTDEAEALVAELQAAIAEAKRLDHEYSDYMRHEREGQ